MPACVPECMCLHACSTSIRQCVTHAIACTRTVAHVCERTSFMHAHAQASDLSDSGMHGADWLSIAITWEFDPIRHAYVSAGNALTSGNVEIRSHQ